MCIDMKFHFLEAICSFFVVGLGQIIKGEGKKGVVLLLIFYFALPAAVYLSLQLNAYFFLTTLGLAIIFGIILWTYSIGDALLKK
ncbi:hypothetical protein AMJ44_11800 [candidate division WOR-1 bacterium DG_54_3]|uniref:Uncharacterized protein n=1 Tax=candidate division WOR-1 bacterium DG_54_3 TaxID=1703775 RepID=A0A0S7XRT2_UNCSA|nr:MAG: hypothetical protein AMJ44_11800 [candidate division WOR-1 bacterium DG_54_3]